MEYSKLFETAINELSDKILNESFFKKDVFKDFCKKYSQYRQKYSSIPFLSIETIKSKYKTSLKDKKPFSILSNFRLISDIESRSLELKHNGYEMSISEDIDKVNDIANRILSLSSVKYNSTNKNFEMDGKPNNIDSILSKINTTIINMEYKKGVILKKLNNRYSIMSKLPSYLRHFLDLDGYFDVALNDPNSNYFNPTYYKKLTVDNVLKMNIAKNYTREAESGSSVIYKMNTKENDYIEFCEYRSSDSFEMDVEDILKK